MQIVESFQALKNVLPLSWSNVTKKRHFFLKVTIKANWQSFIPSPKNHYQLYLAAPVSRNIRTFYLSNHLGKKNPPFFFYLPSTTNSSHVINQVRVNVSLHPIDCPYIDCLMKLSNNIQKPEKSLCPHT